MQKYEREKEQKTKTHNKITKPKETNTMLQPIPGSNNLL